MVLNNMSGLICPKCGRKSEDVEFIEAFCVDCYPANIKVPRKVEIVQCRKCEKIRVKGEWVPYSEKRVAEHVASKCKGEFDSAECSPGEGKITFTIEGKKKVERSIDVELVPTMCTYCSRISGGYYQGLIQLRGNPKRIAKYAKLFVEKLEKRTFITKAEDKHEGVDIYVGSSKAVVEMLTELRMKSLMTRKLVGVQQGKKLYRVTFLLRL
jgi:nonsense-mediated mRNA decay protein 3